MNKVWIFDIDGTLADNEHRMHHLDGKKEWDAFFAKQHLDEPYDAVMTVFHCLIYNRVSIGDKFIILTARDERFREVTVEWLDRHLDVDADCYELIMRPLGFRGDDDKLKVQIIKDILAANPGFQVGAVFDDRHRIIDACRAEGWYTFECNQTRKEF